MEKKKNNINCPSCNTVLTISGEIKKNELIQCPKCEVAINIPLVTKSRNIEKYSDIYEAINNLKVKTGFFIISINDYYVQFSNSLNNQELYCEAVSHFYLPQLVDLTSQFQSLSFALEQNSNYNKNIDIMTVSTKDIISEIEKIFLELYGIPFENYQIRSEFDDVTNCNRAHDQNYSNSLENIIYNKKIVNEPIYSTDKQINWIAVIIVFIIVLVIIGYVVISI